ncbi:putative WRKY transcription factor 2 [Raphanus sativus]|uniref:Probable WRKY transcription factor 2 n=1 Tax=Raphanus sativus TaxID=3726 RepID=A0A6J0MM00_RAPSA|nr:probable WRKY transcription factor 2 [Raphanus sativus]XP_056852113.1 probable WRKY transcription factor 2 [Raphanus sativus]XP_056852114.1 probable WRKY transcription factor 2 [Raphanus sativus]KAJ4868558.1 putative WRKY transcription factor 2 [Raphanus sativus]KAJ4873379.1 putative WRKY transcription factor 2 [Raphanus sativus]
MSGFEENVAVMGEWVPCNPSSKRVLERELSLNHGLVNRLEEEEEDTSGNNKNVSRGGGLRERIAARAGFNTPRLNTENIRSNTDSSLRSPNCLTISSPGLSPATLLESPVFLSNPLAQPSPTTGKFPFLPGVNSSNGLSASDKEKDEFFDGIGASSSFTFHPVSRPSSSFFHGATEMMPVDYGNYNNSSSHHQSPEEDVKLGSEQSGLKRKTSDATTNTNDHQEEEEGEEEQRGGDSMAGGGAPAEDGYNWRKYGQKLVKGSEYPRSYYKCTNPSCPVKKKVERSREGHITEIIYKGAHNHSKPPPNRRSSGTQLDGTEQQQQQQQQQRDNSATWVSCNNTQQQVGSNENNFEEDGNQSGSIQAQESGDVIVVDALSTLSNDEDEDDRGTDHGSASLGYDGCGRGDESESKRRKLEAYAIEMSGATRAIREPRVVVQTTSDVDILDDGYRWRKYGQKVVKGNPNPRSYYKCTAPGCTVRKHVERASHDLKSVITTYEGKHDHDVPAARNSSHGGGNGSSAAQTNHYQEPPRGRYERQLNQSSQFGRPFSFQPHLGPPSGFAFGLGQTGFGNLSIPGLAFGQGKLQGLTHTHPSYMMSQQPGGMSEAMMMQRGMEPKVEPGSETGQSVYNQIMSRLPQI